MGIALIVLIFVYFVNFDRAFLVLHILLIILLYCLIVVIMFGI